MKPDTTRTRRDGALPRRLLGCLLALALLAALLAAAEGLLRALDLAAPPADLLATPGATGPGDGSATGLTQADPHLLYRLRPHAELGEVYRIGAHGFRSPELPSPRPADLLLVAATGDSSTFGMGVADDATWPAQLQRQLAALLEGDRTVAVLGAGVPGYTTEQNLRQLRRELLPFAPDIVALCATGENDSRWAATPGDRALMAAVTPFTALLGELRLLSAFRGPSPLDALRMENLLPHGSPGARARVTPAEFRENLRDFVRAARQQGATAVLVAPAHGAPRVASEPWLSAAEDEVVTAAGDTGALLADARSAFVALSPYPLFSDTIHYVPLGQQLVALSVTAALLEQPAALALGAERARWLEQYRSARDCTGLWPGRTAPPEFPRNLPPCAQEGLFGPGAPPALLLALDATRNQPLQPARARLAAAATRSADALTPDPLLAWVGAAEVSDDETLRAALALVHFEERAGLALPQIPRAFAEGLAAARAGRPELALPRLEAALGAEPELVAAHFERAWLLRRAGRRDEAVRAFEQVAALDPQGALGLCVTGLFALEAGDAAGAESALRAALARDGGSGHARWLLARALLARDALPEARREAETARLLLPGELDVSGLLQRIDERAAEIDGAPR